MSFLEPQMNRTELIESWLHEERQPFTGWDFSYLDGRMTEGQVPWSYLDRAAELMCRSSSVLDLETGGGEKLLGLHRHWPAKVVATEDYQPNFELATKRLSLLGASVVKESVSNIAPMSFADNEFDLILNRHAAFNSSEIARVLANGGTFLTQQVHGTSAWDLQAVFDAKPQWPDSTPEKYLPLLEAAGLTILDAQNWEGNLSFADVGAIVYYLKAVPWLVPNFTIQTHLQPLFVLQDRLESGKGLHFFSARYLIEASAG